MSDILTVENLSVAFNGQHGANKVVKGVSFSLKRGEMLAIVGESGSGKSVSALSIMQLHNPHAVQYPSGSIRYEGEELIGAHDVVMSQLRGNHISMVFQEPMSALNPLHTIGKQLREVITTHQKISNDATNTRIAEVMDLVGLSEFKDRLETYPHHLSGGERQRIMIAMAIANNPDVLIADEPTTALDANLQLQIIDLIKRLQRELNIAVLLITHDLPLVQKTADKVAIMKQGEIVEQGDVAEIFKQPKHAYTQHLLASAPSGGPYSLDKNASAILACEDVCVTFPIKKSFFGKILSEKCAVDNTSLELKQGETLGLVGESGSGKTTLGLALLRLIRSSGNISLDGKTISGLSGKALQPLRQRMQFVFQDPFASLNPRLTIGDIVGEGLRVHSPQISRNERMAKVHTILEEVGLEPSMSSRYPHEFSGGQRQRINIARAMILSPELVVLDEPTSALDLSLQRQIIDLLRGLQKKYKTSYLFISHDLRVIRAMSHRVMIIKNGKIVEEGLTDRIFENPQHDYTRCLLDAAFGADKKP